eukprot:symbB.v1.2.040729.t1/scaffold7474.1/size11042/3
MPGSERLERSVAFSSASSQRNATSVSGVTPGLHPKTSQRSASAPSQGASHSHRSSQRRDAHERPPATPVISETSSTSHMSRSRRSVTSAAGLGIAAMGGMLLGI